MCIHDTNLCVIVTACMLSEGFSRAAVADATERSGSSACVDRNSSSKEEEDLHGGRKCSGRSKFMERNSKLLQADSWHDSHSPSARRE